LYDILEE